MENKIDKSLDTILQASESSEFVDWLRDNKNKSKNTYINRLGCLCEDEIYMKYTKWKRNKNIPLDKLAKEKLEFQELKPIHRDFLEEYTTGEFKDNSLESYRKIKMRVHKVEASTIMFNPVFWREAIKSWSKGIQENDELSVWKQTVVRKSQEYEDKHNLSIWDAFKKYVCEDTHFGDPIPILTCLVDLYWFCETLKRKKYMTACQDVIKDEYDRLQKLIETNAIIWKPKLRKLPKGLQAVLEVVIN